MSSSSQEEVRGDVFVFFPSACDHWHDHRMKCQPQIGVLFLWPREACCRLETVNSSQSCRVVGGSACFEPD